MKPDVGMKRLCPQINNMLEQKDKELPALDAEVQTPEKKQLDFVCRLRPKRGHKLFKFKDGKVEAVSLDEYEEEVLIVGKTSRKRLIIDSGAKYVCALNNRNAIRKLLKGGLIKPSVQSHKEDDRPQRSQ